MKNTRIIIALSFMVLAMAIPATVQAYSVKTDSSIYVGREETIDGTLYAAGNSVIVDGNVAGDVFCAGQTITINGHVAGDVFCAGESITVNGDIGGSIRVVGNSINITASTSGGVQAFGATISLGPDASVGRDMLIAGAVADIRGDVNGYLHGAAGSVIIGGHIGRDIKLRLDERIKGEKYADNYSGPKPLRILPEAMVGGNVYYISGIIGEISEKAGIGGEVGHSFPKKSIDKNDLAAAAIWGRIIFVFAALVVGLVLISIRRERLVALTDLMISQGSATIGWGMIVMFLTPIISILLIFTLIGIPLAAILVSLWLICLYLAKITVAITIGRLIVKRIWGQEKESLIWAMVLGITLSWLAFSLPVIGWIFTLAAFWWGLGGFWLYSRQTT